MKHYWYYTCIINKDDEDIRATGYATSDTYFPLARLHKLIGDTYHVTTDDVLVNSVIEISQEDYAELCTTSKIYNHKNNIKI